MTKSEIKYVNQDVTIRDVARCAKVSTATVSRTLNNPEMVQKETLIKVREAIQKLNYAPNQMGSRLRKLHTRIVLIIMPNISNPFYSDIVEGMIDVARDERYEASICLTQLHADQEMKYMDMLIGNHADGAITLGCELTDPRVIERMKKCQVVQCCEYCKDAGAPHISIDNYAAAFQAVKNLIDIGHKRIGFIGSTNTCVSSIERFEGYKKSLENASLEYSEDIVMYADANYSFSSAHSVSLKMLSPPNRPTAIFAISDMMALAAIAAARSIGIKVPDQLSVFGCDNIEVSRSSTPPISTIDQSGYIMGKRAMKMLIDILENRYVPETEIFVEHKILIRESTGALANLHNAEVIT